MERYQWKDEHERNIISNRGEEMNVYVCVCVIKRLTQLSNLTP